MSYLEEWNNIEGMIENHNTSKSTVITSEKRQALALSHIAKCLSVFADDITDAHESVDSIRRCGECIHQGDTEHCASCQIIFNVTGFEEKGFNKNSEENTNYRFCEDCLHCDRPIDKDPCFSCNSSNWEPKKATDDKPCNNCIHSNDEDELNCGICDEIYVKCPRCICIIPVKKSRFTVDKLHLKCPSCNTFFTYYTDTHVCEVEET